MPPRIRLVGSGLSSISRLSVAPRSKQICPICLFSSTSRPTKSRRTQLSGQHRIDLRRQSGTAGASMKEDAPIVSSQSARVELRDALLDLQKDAASYVNISKLQLALRSLEQTPGEEIIRIAVLAASDGGESVKRAKHLLRLLLADPLKAEEEWERILLDDRPRNKPLLLKIGLEESEFSNPMVQELHISAPTMNGYRLEILVVESGIEAPRDESFADFLLVPMIETATASSGRYTPIATPVHRALFVAQGYTGSQYMVPLQSADPDVVGRVVDIPGSRPDNELAPLHFIDVARASDALALFRKSVDNALDYETNWFASGVPGIVEWLRAGNSSPEGALKPPIRSLVESVVDSTSTAITTADQQRLSAALSLKTSTPALESLRKGLSSWAERAHTELRDQLDIAFDGRRWRKLGWWKLFWRVDDVSMIATDILQQRFLTDAEKQIIFLAGRIEQANIWAQLPKAAAKNWAYKPVEREQHLHTWGGEPPSANRKNFPKEDQVVKLKNQSWPLSIPLTRSYLATDTVPALQALAQKLVLQTLSTSSAVSAFAALTYISTLSTGLYEAGAIAAVGIVWSLRRMQGKWETARSFWEGEVREEGRKAVRGVEGVVGEYLKTPDGVVATDPELEKAKAAVQRAGQKLSHYESL